MPIIIFLCYYVAGRADRAPDGKRHVCPWTGVGQSATTVWHRPCARYTETTVYRSRIPSSYTSYSALSPKHRSKLLFHGEITGTAVVPT